MRRSLIMSMMASSGGPGNGLGAGGGRRGRQRLGRPSRSWRRASAWPSRRVSAVSVRAGRPGSAVDAMARQPGATARIQTAMIIGLALIESLAIFVFVVAVILLFVQADQRRTGSTVPGPRPGRHAGIPARRPRRAR